MSPRRQDLSFALKIGIGVAAAVLATGGINLFFPQFGRAFLDSLARLIPGFERTSTPQKVLTLGFFAGLYAAAAAGLLRWLMRRPRPGSR